MSTVNAFTPKGQTYTVSTTSVQIKTQDNSYAVSYRIRNLLGTAAYIKWAPANPTGTAVTVPAIVTPVAGTPSSNTIGMFPNSIEVISLPPNVWLLADTANAFEVTPGEGL